MVQLLAPAPRAYDAVSERIELAAGHGNDAVARHEQVRLPAKDTDQLIGVILNAQFSDEQIQTLDA